MGHCAGNYCHRYPPSQMLIILYTPPSPPFCCLFHSSNPNLSQRILKKPVHLLDNFTSNPLSHVPPPMTHPHTSTSHWHFQQTGSCSLHFLTYIVTERSHWPHRLSEASYWSSKTASAPLIGWKAELQLCKTSISINCWNNVMVLKLRNIGTGLSSVGHKFLGQRAEAHHI